MRWSVERGRERERERVEEVGDGEREKTEKRIDRGPGESYPQTLFENQMNN